MLPADGILSFITEEKKKKKALMLENCSPKTLDLILKTSISSKEKVFVILTIKNLCFYVALK